MPRMRALKRHKTHVVEQIVALLLKRNSTEERKFSHARAKNSELISSIHKSWIIILATMITGDSQPRGSNNLTTIERIDRFVGIDCGSGRETLMNSLSDNGA